MKIMENRATAYVRENSEITAWNTAHQICNSPWTPYWYSLDVLESEHEKGFVMIWLKLKVFHFWEKPYEKVVSPV